MYVHRTFGSASALKDAQSKSVKIILIIGLSQSVGKRRVEGNIQHLLQVLIDDMVTRRHDTLLESHELFIDAGVTFITLATLFKEFS
jgi:hypothetical protein